MRVVCALNEILAEKQMSKRQLAREAGIGANTVCNIARAHYSDSPLVSLKTLGRICEVLNVIPGDVLQIALAPMPASRAS